MNGTKDYYGGDANIYEVIKIIEHFNLDFREGNVLKYLLRAGKKDPSTRLEDLRKGLYYFQRLVDSEAQKDLTINIKCENNLSPVLEEMHEKVTKIKEDSTINEYRKSLISLVELMGVKDGRDVYEFVDSILNIQLKDLKKEDKPKLISELKVGDEIKAIVGFLMNDEIDGECNALKVGKYYKIKRLYDGQIDISSEIYETHTFDLMDLHEYFHVSK